MESLRDSGPPCTACDLGHDPSLLWPHGTWTFKVMSQHHVVNFKFVHVWKLRGDGLWLCAKALSQGPTRPCSGSKGQGSEH